MACLASQQFLYIAACMKVLCVKHSRGFFLLARLCVRQIWQETDGALNGGTEGSCMKRLFTPMWAG